MKLKKKKKKKKHATHKQHTDLFVKCNVRAESMHVPFLEYFADLVICYRSGKGIAGDERVFYQILQPR